MASALSVAVLLFCMSNMAILAPGAMPGRKHVLLQGVSVTVVFHAKETARTRWCHICISQM